MKEFFESIRLIITGIIEMIFVVAAVCFLIIGEVQYSVAFGIIAICFILLGMSNKLDEIKRRTQDES